MRIGFFLREAVRATRRSAAPSFAALATVLVTLLVLGVFIPIVQATNGAANSVRSRVEVDVYMKTNATAADDARVRQELLNVPHVKQRAVRLQGGRPTRSRPRSTRPPTSCWAPTRCPTPST